MIFEIDKKPSDDKAVIFQNSILTYSDIISRIRAIKQKISRSNCLVFCLCINCPDSLAGYLAFLDSENVPLLLDANIKDEDLKSLIDLYHPDYIWKSVGENSYDYELIQLEKSSFDIKINEKLALLLTTSGTTGSPKLVRLSRENVESNARAIAEYLELNKKERPVTSLPMYYSYGLSVLNSHLLVGACIVMTDKSILEIEFWKFVDTHQVTSFSGVPYSYEMLEALRFTFGSLGKSIKTFTQAGGHLSEKLQKQYIDFSHKFGKKFVVMYGQTEATARMSYLPYESSEAKIGSIGIPIPGGRFELCREDGSIIDKAGEIGELVYHGANVSLGYAESYADLALGDERNGVLHTGDMAERDEDNFYYIRGRKKRFLKMCGNRVSLDECERILKVHFDGANIACAGTDDELIIFFEGERIKGAADYLSELLHLDYHLFKEKTISAFPRTSSGKIDYSRLGRENLKNRDRYIELTDYHKKHCSLYDKMISAVEYEDIPFIPAGIFKNYRLSSLDEGQDFRMATSSGTSDSAKSMVVIDGKTATAQQRALVDIVTEYIGNKRLPMLVIDAKETVNYDNGYSARAAGIQGFSIFGRDRTFALDENLELDVAVVREFLAKYGNDTFLIFGFTYLVWQQLVEKVEALGVSFDMSKGILIHGGGWKKLEGLAVTNEEYKRRLKDSVGIEKSYDYYGMAEQAGSIFMECEHGYLHASKYSDIIARRAKDFSACDYGEKGILQVLSTIPESYPGHSILTEDEGIIYGEDDCPCGRCGKYFRVNGRIKNAVLRGCSDLREMTYEDSTAINSGDIEFVFGNNEVLNRISEEVPYKAFAEDTIDFLNCWSRAIRENKETDRSDIVAFGFWIRKANIELIKKRYSDASVGKGCVLHFAPSNIPTLFSYSLTSSLLSGNSCIIRLPSQEDEGINLLVKALMRATDEWPEFRNRIVLIKYSYDKSITDMLSKLCRARIIWGGDKSIAEITKSPANEGVKDICFGDRDSFAVIDSLAVLKSSEQEMDSLIYNFYNDTYLTDQNACSSPKLILWQGDDDTCEAAKVRFWSKMHSYLLERYQISDLMAIKKLENIMGMAAELEGGKCENNFADNLIKRMSIDDVSCDDYAKVWDFTMPGGFFIEKCIKELAEVNDFVTDKCQTVVVYGIDNLKAEGIRRIVPAGHGLMFDLFWDGVDLISEQTVLKGV